jgi:Glycosyltransferase family 87
MPDFRPGLPPGQRERLDRFIRRVRGWQVAFRERSLATPGFRVVYRIGGRRFVRAVGIGIWIAALIAVPKSLRPELVHPADIGSDQSNYLAATERLAAGHDVYALVAGDRPTPLDNPPEWSVPILSPPAVATFDLWKMALPDWARFYVGWALGLGAIAALGLILLWLGPIALVPLVMLLSQPLAVTAWSGNVNALIGPGAALVWWAARRPSGRWHVLAGVIVALGACIKLGPVMLGFWLLAQRRFLAVATAVVIALVVVAVTLVMAGPGVLAEFLGVVRSTTATPTPLSIPGLFRGLGFSPPIQVAMLPIALVAATVLIFVTRRSPISFALAILAMTFSTTVVREETISIALVAGVAWIGTVTPSEAREQAIRPKFVVEAACGFGFALAALGIILSFVTGGGFRSTLAVSNSTDQPLVVRFSLYSQSGTYGYWVPAQSAIYGWSDLPGGAPPVMTVWTPACELVDIVDVPRAGGSFDVGASGVRATDGSNSPQVFGDYVPDCAANVFSVIETR